MRSRRPTLATLALCLATGCQHDREPGAGHASGPAPPTSAPSRVTPENAPIAGERVEIPGGAFKAGSRPGDPGREPTLEPRSTKLELGPFEVDRLPYPNDPTKPFLTGVGRDRASRLCAERGSRLCTELEWERACKGPTSEPFSTGDAWKPECAGKSARCASGFDVLAMGSIREWTASDVVTENEARSPQAAIRGSAPGAPGPEHACARRRALDAEETADDLGFRCCKGAPNAAKVKEPREGQTFEKVKLTAAQLERLLGAASETERLAKDIQFFREPDAAQTVIDRGPGDRKGFLFTVVPLKWNPVAGVEFLVVPARAGKNTSFVVVFLIVGDDEYELASSFIMEDEVGPVALAYNGYIRPRLHFSTCWGCPGETGKVLHRDGDAAWILQP